MRTVSWMLQQPECGGFVVASGERHSVREPCEVALGLDGPDWVNHVRVDERCFRPTEEYELCGDASKVRRVLGWEPRTTFQGLVRLMLDHDLVEAGLPAGSPVHDPSRRSRGW